MVNGRRADAETDPATWSADIDRTNNADVTIRHPAARHIASKAARTAGAAAAAGEQDKYRRYGSSITAVAVETFGRIGTQGDLFLARLETAAKRLDDLKGWPVRERMAGWRARLSVTLQRAMARQLPEARGTPAPRSLRPGTHTTRCRQHPSS